MSGRISVRPDELISMAGQMRGFNQQVVNPIKDGIQARNDLNNHMANSKATREERLITSMLSQLDFAGLSRLIMTFTNSYNMRRTHGRSLDRILGHQIPTSMSARFERRLSTEELRANPTWSVGGSRWGMPSNNREALSRHYINVVMAIQTLLNAVDSHEATFQSFVKMGAPSRYPTTPSTGIAGRALVSRVNYAVNYAIEAFFGVSGARSGLADAIVACVAEALAVCTRNTEIVYLVGDELADQAISLANDRRAFDQVVARGIANQTGNIVHQSQLRRSQVELTIYRPDLLADEKGVESALVEQLEERYRDLHDRLTYDLFEVANFIYQPTNGRTLTNLCDEAISAIDTLRTFLSRSVSFITDLNGAVGTAMARFEGVSSSSGGRTIGQLRDQLGDNLADDLDMARRTLNTWREGFVATQDRARDFVSSINNGVHVNRLHERLERAIFPTTAFEPLSEFARNAQSRLMTQAREYTRTAALLRQRMSGPTVTAYARALDRGANYVTAVAQSIEKDIFGGVLTDGISKVNNFSPRSSSRLVWSRKTATDLMAMLINNGEVNWVLLEELIGSASYQDITNETFVALAMLVDQLSTNEDNNELNRFFYLIAQQTQRPGGLLSVHSNQPTTWSFCQQMLTRIQSNLNGMAEIARIREQYLEDMGKEPFFENLTPRDRANLVRQFQNTAGDGSYSDDELWNFLIEELQRQQENSFERSAIFHAARSLDVITGVEGGNGPNINISGSSGAGFTVTTAGLQIMRSERGTFAFTPQQETRISAVTNSNYVYYGARSRMQSGLTDALSFDVAEHLRGEARSFIIGEAFSAVPFVAPALAIASAATSTHDGLREAEQNINLLNDHLGNVDQAHLASHLRLQGIFIDDGNGASHLMLRPTRTTDYQLAYHNNRRRENNPNHRDVTMGELSRNPSEAFRRLFVPQ